MFANQTLKNLSKRDTVIYRIVLAIFSIMILLGAITYFANYEMVSEMFTSLGVPTEIIYPLAVAKILGIATLWFIKSPMLKTLAFIGFGLDLVMAMISHLNAGDGGAFGPAIPFALLVISYIYYRKTHANKQALS